MRRWLAEPQPATRERAASAASSLAMRATVGRADEPSMTVPVVSWWVHRAPATMRSMRVLVVEDEPQMARVIRRSLAKEGLAADVANRGEEAVAMTRGCDYDAIVLDLMLPGMSGLTACRRMREQGVWAPVLMLTARESVADRVAGLDSGADDYLVKPFALAELHARLRSLARRGAPERPAVVEVGDFVLDPARRKVSRGEVGIDLSTKEFAVLEMLVRHRGEVLSRLDLIEHAWDRSYEIRSNVVDVYVRRLREKVDRPFGRRSIETVRGAGYRFREEPDAAADQN